MTDPGRRLRDVIARIAPSDLTVVLVCDDPARRRRIAATIHRRSTRAAGSFRILDCAAAGAELEAALFGRADAPGVLERAAGGTAFLDRIDVLPGAIQLELLRTLEERQLFRVESRTARPIDVRLIVASSRDLAEDVEHGRLRADLFYRLAGIAIEVPPMLDPAAEREQIMRALEACAGNQTRAARMLGVSRGALIGRLERYRVPRPRKGR